MEKYTIAKDIPVFYITAGSFPNGVEAAHKKLRAKMAPDDNRTFFGISHSDGKGNIIYKAAAEELYAGETEKLGLEKFVIKKGEYMSQLLPNFCDNVAVVGETFKELLALPDLDPQGYCLELYLSLADMRCMVPLKK
ncbi:MAG: transcriptional regulator [Bacteroidota bacterium]